MSAETSTRSIKLLEIIMRDVLDGLEDAASYMNYNSVPDVVEILSIESPGRSIQTQSEAISITNISVMELKQNTNIVDYLIQRELRKTA